MVIFVLFLRNKNPDLIEYMKPMVKKTEVDVLKVTYQQPNGTKIIAHLGVKLDSEMIKNEPNVSFDRLKNDSYYTLLFVDPDLSMNEPNNDQIYGRIYWLLYNLTADNSHNVKAPYLAPATKTRFENHRFMFLIYKQNGTFDNILPNKTLNYPDISNRDLIHMKSFEKMNNLKLVAANFFYCESSSVMIHHKNKLYDREENEKPKGANFQKVIYGASMTSRKKNLKKKETDKKNDSAGKRGFTALANLNQVIRNSKLNCFN